MCQCLEEIWYEGVVWLHTPEDRNQRWDRINRNECWRSINTMSALGREIRSCLQSWGMPSSYKVSVSHNDIRCCWQVLLTVSVNTG